MSFAAHLEGVRSADSVRQRLFPVNRLSRWDYVAGLATLAGCFLLFFHRDLWRIGWATLNYLYGSPLSFYDNCKCLMAAGRHDVPATAYPPTIYLLFAAWLSPFAALKVITGPETFPIYLTYWLKVLTTVIYFWSGTLFYRVMREYGVDTQWSRYATWAWLTMPMALFTQFIFSQVDIFYVALTIAGFLMFLRQRTYAASALFALAITFKYFPVFAFLPLLLLNEKRPTRILVSLLIFLIPTVVIQAIYGHSPAFAEDVQHHATLSRVFTASIDDGGWHVYWVFFLSFIISGIAYFTEVGPQTRLRINAYVWLVASTVPFLFFYWHPQWTLSFMPAIVLTTMIDRRFRRFQLLDLVAMFLFVAIGALAFPQSVDANLFRGTLLGLPGLIPFPNTYSMSQVFDWLEEGRAVSLFFSCFAGYLLLNIILKWGPPWQAGMLGSPEAVNYRDIRQRFYVGLLIFLLPVGFSIYKAKPVAAGAITDVAMIESLGRGARTCHYSFIR